MESGIICSGGKHLKTKDIFILVLILLVLPGCRINDFSHIPNNFMQTPKLSQKQQLLKNSLENYFGSEIAFKYHILNNRYSSISKIEFHSDDKLSYKLAFCKTIDDSDNLYILLLAESELEQWKVVGEICINESDLESVYIKDVNNDGRNEILVCKKVSDKDFYTDVYSYNGSDVVFLKVLEGSIFKKVGE